MKKKEEYLNSKEAKKVLKVKDCDLAHIRTSGKLMFIKKGNAFLYLRESIEDYKNFGKFKSEVL